MQADIRPWITSGIAVVGASVITVAPIAPPPAVPAPSMDVSAAPLALPDIQLTASIADILTLPVLRQYIVNQIDDLLTLGVGLAGSGAGLGQAIADLPGALVNLTQQFFTGDFEGALTTIEDYLLESGAAIILPTLAAIIERRQRYAEVVLALQSAFPLAVVQLGTGIFDAVDAVARAAIQGGTIVADAILDGDFGNLIPAFVAGAGVFFESFGAAGQDLIDGIYLAQQTLAAALDGIAPPPPVLPTVQELDEMPADPGELSFSAATTSTFTLDTSSVGTDDGGTNSGAFTTDPIGLPDPDSDGTELSVDDEGLADESEREVEADAEFADEVEVDLAGDIADTPASDSDATPADNEDEGTDEPGADAATDD